MRYRSSPFRVQWWYFAQGNCVEGVPSTTSNAPEVLYIVIVYQYYHAVRGTAVETSIFCNFLFFLLLQM